MNADFTPGKAFLEWEKIVKIQGTKTVASDAAGAGVCAY